MRRAGCGIGSVARGLRPASGRNGRLGADERWITQLDRQPLGNLVRIVHRVIVSEALGRADSLLADGSSVPGLVGVIRAVGAHHHFGGVHH